MWRPLLVALTVGWELYALVAVSDTGDGFDEAVKNRLFEPSFFKDENRPGRGFGLAAVHRIVIEAGGWIRVHSQPKKGTRCEVYLPQIERELQRTS